jgi:hypothetical protein
MLMGQLYRLGFSANAAIKELRNMGYGYRRGSMLQDYRSITGKMRRQDAVEALAPDVRPSKYHMVETELRRPERSYRVFGELDIYDWDQGKWVSKPVSFYDDYLRTKEGWISKFIQDFQPIYGRYNQTIQSMRITAIEHNKGHFY